MISIDVVCEAENLPRIRLLQSHMLTLHVRLEVHAEHPEFPTPRLLMVPKKSASRLAHSDEDPNHERIALYLDENSEQIDADLAVQLHNWPARSSDSDVLRLAAHLRKPFVPGSPKSSLSQDPKRAAPNQRQNRRALVGFAVLATLFVGLIVLEQQESDETPDEPLQSALALPQETALLDTPTQDTASLDTTSLDTPVLGTRILETTRQQSAPSQISSEQGASGKGESGQGASGQTAYPASDTVSTMSPPRGMDSNLASQTSVTMPASPAEPAEPSMDTPAKAGPALPLPKQPNLPRSANYAADMLRWYAATSLLSINCPITAPAPYSSSKTNPPLHSEQTPPQCSDNAD